MRYEEAVVELKQRLIIEFKLEEWHADVICNSIRCQSMLVNDCVNHTMPSNWVVLNFNIWGDTNEGVLYWKTLYDSLKKDGTAQNRLRYAETMNAEFLKPPRRPAYHINIMD